MGIGPMTVWQDSLDSIYDSDLAVAGLLRPGASSSAGLTDGLTVTVLDKTAGMEIPDQREGLTIKPGACIRMSELTAAGIDHQDLDEGTLTLGSKPWRIAAHMLRPTPDGELMGEALMILFDEDVP